MYTFVVEKLIRCTQSEVHIYPIEIGDKIQLKGVLEGVKIETIGDYFAIDAKIKNAKNYPSKRGSFARGTNTYLFDGKRLVDFKKIQRGKILS